MQRHVMERHPSHNQREHHERSSQRGGAAFQAIDMASLNSGLTKWGLLCIPDFRDEPYLF